MLRQSIQAASPEFQKLVDDLIAEETRSRATERRRVGREVLVRPVSIECRGPEPAIIQAFSRDLSGLGIGLISDQPIREGITARLHIQRLQGRPTVVLAECRWCEPYAQEWYMTGWTFTSIESV